MEVSYDALRRVLLEERKGSGLQQLDDAFYSSYREHLRKLRAGANDARGIKAFDDMARCLKELSWLRLNKITLKALRDSQKNAMDGDGLASEEKGFYTDCVNIMQKFGECAECAPVERKRRLRACADIPAFASQDGSGLGPFRKGEILDVPEDAGSLLLKRALAEEI
ncbi:hypothetical protein COU36_00735 [Candidatus Micrarchaeota archaeon CG10_big_fil_rev_8_21_14_0_10_59_7]|nr:MAG: hypothetical protein COU36_00735 [Candidatus Micrarchaeota archaeon CG10_big_fil_rev_8_21_14_0_10_59_7]